MTASTPICPRYGEALPEGTGFCSSCGTVVPMQQSRPTPQAARPATESPSLSGQDNLPPEFFSGQAPKPRRPPIGFGFKLIWKSIGLMIIGALFLFLPVGVFIRESNAYSRLAIDGLQATAIITDLEINSGGEFSTQIVTYQFPVQKSGDTVHFQGMDHVSFFVTHDLQVGQTIDVVYWTTDPSVSAVKAELQPPAMELFLLVGGMGGIVLLLALSNSMAIVYTIRLLLSGQVAQGIVCKKWWDSDNDGTHNNYVAYTYRVNIPGKGIQQFFGAERNNNIYDNVEVGGTLTVRYLPGQPEICMIQENKKNPHAIGTRGDV